MVWAARSAVHPLPIGIMNAPDGLGHFARLASWDLRQAAIGDLSALRTIPTPRSAARS
ncbi:MAG: hypothetical protein VB065_04010 [Eubacteriales bacterium]|nr:hypothetical protein [Eubacteriales bacterium]